MSSERVTAVRLCVALFVLIGLLGGCATGGEVASPPQATQMVEPTRPRPTQALPNAPSGAAEPTRPRSTEALPSAPSGEDALAQARLGATAAQAMCMGNKILEGSDNAFTQMICADALQADKRLRELRSHVEPSQPGSQVGYGATRWGMLPKEVQQQIAGLHAGRANRIRYLRKRAEILGHWGDTLYLFGAEEGRLSDVLIVFRTDRAKQLFDELVLRLTREHGSPLAWSDYTHYTARDPFTNQVRTLPTENALHMKFFSTQEGLMMIAASYPFADVVVLQYMPVGGFSWDDDTEIAPFVMESP